jgi:hypothetical protein
MNTTLLPYPHRRLLVSASANPSSSEVHPHLDDVPFPKEELIRPIKPRLAPLSQGSGGASRRVEDEMNFDCFGA